MSKEETASRQKFLIKRQSKQRVIMQYSFDIAVAKRYGADGATILSNLRYWILHNKANRKNFHEGKYWTFNTNKTFSELFPWLSSKQIWLILDKLEKDSIIEKGNFNSRKYDRTTWYTMTLKGEMLFSDYQEKL
ncbi:MAG: hypothetical protein FWH22_11340, partial [Fibromonadales bacterium]|nr:hypothetical protein [Fibromonadales bacterium]